MIRCYSELICLPTFEERYQYLRLASKIGIETFGFDRYLNQMFYKGNEWLTIRNHIIVRDNACDLGLTGYDIIKNIRIHHMNPMTIDEVEAGSRIILDPEFLICTSLATHSAIHYGSDKTLTRLPKERRKGDTTLWRR